MADTRSDITIPSKSWVNVYTLSGIAVGTAVTIINKGASAFYVCVQASQPSAPVGMPKGMPCYPQGSYASTIYVDSGATGLWAYCDANSASYALVQE